jgi:hypothetical protein
VKRATAATSAQSYFARMSTHTAAEVMAELGQLAAEIDEPAREWHEVDRDSSGPALLAHWRTRIVLAAMKLEAAERGDG